MPTTITTGAATTYLRPWLTTVGQTFTPPPCVSSLTSLTFTVRGGENSVARGATLLRASLSRFAYSLGQAADESDGAPFGAPLFDSAPVSGPAGTAMVDVVFATGGVAVTPGERYLAILAIEAIAGSSTCQVACADHAPLLNMICDAGAPDSLLPLLPGQFVSDATYTQTERPVNVTPEDWVSRTRFTHRAAEVAM